MKNCLSSNYYISNRHSITLMVSPMVDTGVTFWWLYPESGFPIDKDKPMKQLDKSHFYLSIPVQLTPLVEYVYTRYRYILTITMSRNRKHGEIVQQSRYNSYKSYNVHNHRF